MSGGTLAAPLKYFTTEIVIQKIFVVQMHLLKLAKIWVVLIQKNDRKKGLALPEVKITRKHMFSFKNRRFQTPRKMHILRIFILTGPLSVLLLRNTK